MADFTKEQALEAKYYLQRTYECALLAYHDVEEWSCQYWLKEANEAFKKAATALGFLIEPISKDAASKPEARAEAGSGEGTAIPPTSSARGGFAVEGQ